MGIRLLFIIVATCFLARAQNNFLKVFSGSTSYTLIFNSGPAIDTLSQSSLILAASYSRNQVSANDTLVSDGFLLKNNINGLTNWIVKYHLKGGSLRFTDIKVLATKDIIVGGRIAVSNFVTHGVLLKTDSFGNVKWLHVYPYTQIDKVLGLKGASIAFLARDSSNRFKIGKLDGNGNAKWIKVQQGAANSGNTGLGLTEGPNGNILACGYNGMAFAFLFDSLGNKINDLTMTNPILGRAFYSALNFNNNGYFLVGVGQGAGTNIASVILRVDNNLNLIWYKNFQTANTHCEFMDIKAYDNNNLVILTEPEGLGSLNNPHQVGLTFIDSNCVINRNHLFIKDSAVAMPNTFLILKNDKILFNGYGWLSYQNVYSTSPYFGVTDTSSGNFCGYKPFVYTQINPSETVSTNTVSFSNSNLPYFNGQYIVYQPADINIGYSCSTGPTGPMDPFTVGFADKNETDKIKLFPNPANESLVVSLDNGFSKINRILSIKILDALGKERRIDYTLNDNNVLLSTKILEEGVYIIQLQYYSEKTVIEKFVVKH